MVFKKKLTLQVFISQYHISKDLPQLCVGHIDTIARGAVYRPSPTVKGDGCGDHGQKAGSTHR